MWVCLKTFLLRNPYKIYINQISVAGILRRFILPNKSHLSVACTLRSDVYNSKMIALIRIDRVACILHLKPTLLTYLIANPYVRLLPRHSLQRPPMRAIFSLLVTVVYQPEFLPPTFTIIVYPRYVAHYQNTVLDNQH
jgi:hypothetical protein